MNAVRSIGPEVAIIECECHSAGVSVRPLDVTVVFYVDTIYKPWVSDLVAGNDKPVINIGVRTAPNLVSVGLTRDWFQLVAINDICWAVACLEREEVSCDVGIWSDKASFVFSVIQHSTILGQLNVYRRVDIASLLALGVEQLIVINCVHRLIVGIVQRIKHIQSVIVLLQLHARLQSGSIHHSPKSI